MSRPLIVTPRALTLLTCIHVAELRRARSAIVRLVLMREYGELLRRSGIPVVAWWRAR